jgi:hypothetical protein
MPDNKIKQNVEFRITGPAFSAHQTEAEDDTPTIELSCRTSGFRNESMSYIGTRRLGIETYKVFHRLNHLGMAAGLWPSGRPSKDLEPS